MILQNYFKLKCGLVVVMTGTFFLSMTSYGQSTSLTNSGVMRIDPRNKEKFIPVAVIDAGVDFNHEKLAPYRWINPVDNINASDDDRNGFTDDTYGWNVLDSNNVIYNGQNYESLFPRQDDFKRYSELSGKVLRYSEASGESLVGEEIDFLRKCDKEENFHENFGKFIRMIHGTHVSGIITRDNGDVRVMPVVVMSQPKAYNNHITQKYKLSQSYLERIKLSYPKIVKLFSNSIKKNIAKNVDKNVDKNVAKNLQVKEGDQPSATIEQFELDTALFTELDEIAFKYVNSHKIPIVNISANVSFEEFRPLIEYIYMSWLSRYQKPNEPNIVPDKASVDRELTKFMTKMNQSFMRTFSRYPSTLFIIASGNEATDTDKFPSRYTVKNLPNVISVASTLNDVNSSNNNLVSFSNYGATTVDIAAPGVNIDSAIPITTYAQTQTGAWFDRWEKSRNAYLKMSGTSVSAPIVTNVASRVWAINPKLSAAQVKDIILKSAAKKDFLKGKVVSEGILDQWRAIELARASLGTTPRRP